MRQARRQQRIVLVSAVALAATDPLTLGAVTRIVETFRDPIAGPKG